MVGKQKDANRRVIRQEFTKRPAVVQQFGKVDIPGEQGAGMLYVWTARITKAEQGTMVQCRHDRSMEKRTVIQDKRALVDGMLYLGIQTLQLPHQRPI